MNSLANTSFFEDVKTLPSDWLTREQRLSGASQTKKKRFVGRYTRQYWANRVKTLTKTERDRESIRAKRDSLYLSPSLSDVPKKAAAVPDARLKLLGDLFGVPELSGKPNKWQARVTLQIAKGHVKVRVESDRARLARQMYGTGLTSTSRRLVNHKTGEILSVNGYLGASEGRHFELLQAQAEFKRKIREFSEKSRSRLALMAHELTAQGIKPKFMNTLTYPGDWRSVAPDGRAVKRHMKAYEKRLKRYFGRLGMGVCALWFLEFQKRGAPHVHLMLWGDTLELSENQYRRAQVDLREMWAQIVNHSDPVHRERGRRRGVGFERSKKGHFGYAVKYATKMKQKEVPEGFENVGRFWGYWKYKKPVPDVYSIDVDYQQLVSLYEACYFGLRCSSDKTVNFINNTLGRMLPKTELDYSDWNKPVLKKTHEVTFSATIFGQKSAIAVWHWISKGFKFDISDARTELNFSSG